MAQKNGTNLVKCLKIVWPISVKFQNDYKGSLFKHLGGYIDRMLDKSFKVFSI